VCEDSSEVSHAERNRAVGFRTRRGHQKECWLRMRTQPLEPVNRYSTLILAARITLLHFAASAAMNFPKSPSEPASGTAPKSASRALMSGSARAAFISLFSFSMISGGVFLGATTPNQLLASKPGRNSLTVGTSGRIFERSAVVTANARSLPALTCAMDDGVSANSTCT